MGGYLDRYGATTRPGPALKSTCVCICWEERERGVLGLTIACDNGHRHWVFEYPCPYQSPFGFVWCVKQVGLVPFSSINCDISHIQYMQCVYNPAPIGHQGSPLPLKHGAVCFGLIKLPTHSLTKDRVRPPHLYWSPGARL